MGSSRTTLLALVFGAVALGIAVIWLLGGGPGVTVDGDEPAPFAIPSAPSPTPAQPPTADHRPVELARSLNEGADAPTRRTIYHESRLYPKSRQLFAAIQTSSLREDSSLMVRRAVHSLAQFKLPGIDTTIEQLLRQHDSDQDLRRYLVEMKARPRNRD